MSYVLGLDTGGTYTDGALIDVRTERIVAKAKVFTTKHDLKTGIGKCIDSLNICDPNEIKMVSLSTTLATNAVVEERWGKTGLIIVGKNYPETIPTEYIENIDGKTDIKGNVIIPVSEKQVREAVDRLKLKVNAIAISAYASVRNPKEELRIKKIAEERTSLPVFCAHELTGTLGFAERTNTAVLNAGLTGIVKDFIESTKISLKNKNIKAELMIVKSDGSLMREKMALRRPIDTILSGPAASAIGARHLTGTQDALILDMGGTTIDIADISEGEIRTGDDCAKVAGWRTRVHAVEVSTHGIGGDSLITAGNEKPHRIHVGPQKAEPISRTAYIYDNIIHELKDIQKYTGVSPNKKEILGRCYCLVSEDNLYNGEKIHDQIIDSLREAPHSMQFLVQKAGNDINDTAKTIESMIRNRQINIVDITPTDILHVLGEYVEWSKAAAEIRSKIVAEAVNMSFDCFVRHAEEAIYKRIYMACVQAAADFEGGGVDIERDDVAIYLIDKMFSSSLKEFLTASCRLGKQLIAVGAPVRAWIPFISNKMDTKVLLPQHGEVANAIGSAFGEVNEFAEALIRKENGKRRYNLYLPSEKKAFYSRKSAVEEAERILTQLAKEKAELAGCSKTKTALDVKDIYVNPFGEKKKKFTETHIRVSAKGRPDVWTV